LFVVMACVWLGASVASADATVSVTLKGKDGKPTDGKVILSAADGRVLGTCTTEAGRCEMGGVPGGHHVVTVEPNTGSAPKPRRVMIPPAGKVSLVVTSG
jgi:hypothetical protein